MTSDLSLTEIIQSLEEKLLCSSIRSNQVELYSLLDDNFIEYGSSGKVYNKQDVISRLQNEETFEYTISNFTTTLLSDDVVIATYKIEIVKSKDQTNKKSLRSSVWKRTNNKWQMVFHQGTLLC